MTPLNMKAGAAPIRLQNLHGGIFPRDRERTNESRTKSLRSAPKMEFILPGWDALSSGCTSSGPR